MRDSPAQWESNRNQPEIGFKRLRTGRKVQINRITSRDQGKSEIRVKRKTEIFE